MKRSDSQPTAAVSAARFRHPMSRVIMGLAAPKSRLARLISILTLVAFAVTILPVSALAQDDSSKISLKKGFFKPLRYEIGVEKPKSVYGFTGMSFSTSFEQLISQNPAAYAEAKKAHAYNGLAFAGNLAMVGITAKMFLGTLGQANDVNSGRFAESDNSSMTGDLLLLGAAALVSIVASNLGHSHLKKGVQIYNEASGGFVPATSTSSVAPTGYPMPMQAPVKHESFGVRVGLSSANVSGKYVEGSSSKTGITAGIYYRHSINDRISLQTEGLVVSKGYKYSMEYYGYKYDYSLGLTYLEVPVLARIELGSSGLRPRLLAGPSFGFLVGSKASLNGEKSKVDGVKSFETGLVIGAGVYLGSTPLSLDARYSIGMSAINETPKGYTSDYQMKNRALSFSLGYAF